MNFMPITYSTKLGGLSVYGDGIDGDVTISTNTTLIKDMYYNNLTINASCNLDPAGFRIFVKETLTFTDSTSTIKRLSNTSAYGTLAGAHNASISSYSTSAASPSEKILGGRSEFVLNDSSATQEYFYDITKFMSAMYLEANAPVFGGASGTKGAVGSDGTDGDDAAGESGSAGEDPTDGNTEGVPGGKGTPGLSGTKGTKGTGGAGGTGGLGGPIISVFAKNIVGNGSIIADGFSASAGSAGTPGNAGTTGSAGTPAPDKIIPGNVASYNPDSYPVSQSSYTNPTYYYYAAAYTNPTYYNYVAGQPSTKNPNTFVPSSFYVASPSGTNPPTYSVAQPSTKNPGGTYNKTFYSVSPGTFYPATYGGSGAYFIAGNSNPSYSPSYPVAQAGYTNSASYPVSQSSFSNPTYYYTVPGNAASYNPSVTRKGGAGGAGGVGTPGNSGLSGSNGYVGGGGIIFLMSTGTIPSGLTTSVKPGTTGQKGQAADGKVLVINHTITA